MATQLAFIKDEQAQEPMQEAGLSAQSPLHRAISDYRVHMVSQSLSPYTIKAFDSDLGLLARYLGNRRVLGGIGTADLEGFLQYLRQGRGVPCNLKSLARRVTTLKVFFGWLVASHVLPRDPAAPLVHRRPGNPLPQILAEPATENLLACASTARSALQKPDSRPLLLLTLLLSTGIKKGECMALALSDLNMSDPAAPSAYIRYESARLKFKERRLRLPSSFPSLVSEYFEQYRPKDLLFECTARNLEYVLAEYSRRAGLPVHSVSFESLRWTCAIRDLESAMEPDVLRRKLGLSQITWAASYEKLQRLMTPAL